jgi:hypothetical protein
MRTSLQRDACGLMLVLVAACGGGDSPAPTPAPTPTLNVAYGLKELQFSWAAASGATFYRLFEDPDGVAGYSQVGGDLTALSYNQAISVHRRVDASYRLDACGSQGCTVAGAVTPGSNLTQAIGYLKPSMPGENDLFGMALALSGDGNTLAVGAMNSGGTGAVFMFIRGASGWAQQARLTASNAGALDAFGFAVALSADGNTLAVGAYDEDSSTTGVNSTPNELASGSGAVYVFTRSGAAWSQQAYLKASNTAMNDRFGFSVALSGEGDTLAAGAYQQALSGAAYVFTRTAAVWSQQAFLKASNAQGGDRFGWSVALNGDGNMLAVGAPVHTVNFGPIAGSAYVFVRSAGAWSEQASVTGSNTASGHWFGSSIALSTDANTLAVGAIGERTSNAGVNALPDFLAADAGAAYVFIRSAGAWSQQAFMKATNPGAGDKYGTFIALSADGNSLAVGAPLEDSGTRGVHSTPDEAASASGAVYAYFRSGSRWSTYAYLKAPNTAAGDQFGAVALSGDGGTLAVGAPFEDSNSTGVGSMPNYNGINNGAVYLY